MSKIHSNLLEYILGKISEQAQGQDKSSAPALGGDAASPDGHTQEDEHTQEQNASGDVSANARAESLVALAAAPITEPGRAALLKPAEAWTQSEVNDVVNTAQSSFKGRLAGDPLKAHMYERAQDWHTAVYGDGPQICDGGKPVEPTPIAAIPEQPSPHRTPDGEDLWQASARIGQRVAEAAGTDGYENAVTGLQRGLNILGNRTEMPRRSPVWGPYTPQAPVEEDGEYGPQTDFTLKYILSRLGSAKVDDALALGRFNTFARNVQANGDASGLDNAADTAFAPLFRAAGSGPTPEANVLQETLNAVGPDHVGDWQPLKVDGWIGPKTTEAFGRVMGAGDADGFTRSLGQGLGLL
jgi:hypothetical protein